MIIVVDSLSGRGQAFADQLGLPTQTVFEPLNEPCILVTRNEGLGKIAASTELFLKQHADLVKGVVVNGMKRFGPFYNKAASKIEKQYGLVIISRIELSGTPEDVEKTKQYIAEVNG